jgi:magnesium transporter
MSLRKRKITGMGRRRVMLTIYKTDEGIIKTMPDYDDGVWVRLVEPTRAELTSVAGQYSIDVADLATALDDEESARISLEDGYTLIIADIPSSEVRHEKKMYTTIPMGIVLKQNAIITICREESPIIEYFARGKQRDFSTKKKMRFVYQILFRSASMYQACLRSIDRKRVEIEERADKDMKDGDVIDLHELESTLVYFATSLRSNSVVLERLRRYKRIEQYPEDMELLEDVMVEYQQAIEMTVIYRDIVDGTRELLSSVMNNKLNNVMKYLTSITLVMAIPSVISGVYGMNMDTEWMPFATVPYGFEIVCGIIIIICVVILWILRKKRML